MAGAAHRFGLYSALRACSVMRLRSSGQPSVTVQTMFCSLGVMPLASGTMAVEEAAAAAALLAAAVPVVVSARALLLSLAAAAAVAAARGMSEFVYAASEQITAAECTAGGRSPQVAEGPSLWPMGARRRPAVRRCASSQCIGSRSACAVCWGAGVLSRSCPTQPTQPSRKKRFD